MVHAGNPGAPPVTRRLREQPSASKPWAAAELPIHHLVKDVLNPPMRRRTLRRDAAPASTVVIGYQDSLCLQRPRYPQLLPSSALQSLPMDAPPLDTMGLAVGQRPPPGRPQSAQLGHQTPSDEARKLKVERVRRMPLSKAAVQHRPQSAAAAIPPGPGVMPLGPPVMAWSPAASKSVPEPTPASADAIPIHKATPVPMPSPGPVIPTPSPAPAAKTRPPPVTPQQRLQELEEQRQELAQWEREERDKEEAFQLQLEEQRLRRERALAQQEEQSRIHQQREMALRTADEREAALAPLQLQETERRLVEAFNEHSARSAIALAFQTGLQEVINRLQEAIDTQAADAQAAAVARAQRLEQQLACVVQQGELLRLEAAHRQALYLAEVAEASELQRGCVVCHFLAQEEGRIVSAECVSREKVRAEREAHIEGLGRLLACQVQALGAHAAVAEAEAQGRAELQDWARHSRTVVITVQLSKIAQLPAREHQARGQILAEEGQERHVCHIRTRVVHQEFEHRVPVLLEEAEAWLTILDHEAAAAACLPSLRDVGAPDVPGELLTGRVMLFGVGMGQDAPELNYGSPTGLMGLNGAALDALTDFQELADVTGVRCNRPAAPFSVFTSPDQVEWFEAAAGVAGGGVFEPPLRTRYTRMVWAHTQGLEGLQCQFVGPGPSADATALPSVSASAPGPS
uniref:Uncharacterized protein n=1 Tax=Eutreptiella gymnastica TaxID=73025 RepID=A0A7S1NEZ5_9EUGL|mmetsp:Transcript_28279/g.50893  ORF Transcript_28279/g.50893 Transcript_28279/m.50893 type:complete len:688 (+) Transcript_28279:89-2152(+)